MLTPLEITPDSTVSQVAEGFKNTSEYIELVAEKMIQTIGVATKAIEVQKEENTLKGRTTLSYIQGRICASRYQVMTMQTTGAPICSRNFPMSTSSSCSLRSRSMPRLVRGGFLLGWLQTKSPLTPRPARK